MRIEARGIIVFMLSLFAVVLSADIAPDAADMLLARGKGEKDVWIANVYYSCVGGNSFAMVRNGKPEKPEDYDVVEAETLTVYAPKSMSFKGGIPQIRTFPRRTGFRDVGVPNVIN